MFTKILIANRGVAAVRIARTLKRMGIASVALRTTAEKDSQYFKLFDEVYDLAGDSVAETYLDVEQILAIARAKAEAIHPGYGFLSENADFAAQVAKAGLAFLGPTPDVINVFGLKHEARAMAQAQGVPILEGTSVCPIWRGARGSRRGRFSIAAQEHCWRWRHRLATLRFCARLGSRFRVRHRPRQKQFHQSGRVSREVHHEGAACGSAAIR